MCSCPCQIVQLRIHLFNLTYIQTWIEVACGSAPQRWRGRVATAVEGARGEQSRQRRRPKGGDGSVRRPACLEGGQEGGAGAVALHELLVRWRVRVVDARRVDGRGIGRTCRSVCIVEILSRLGW